MVLSAWQEEGTCDPVGFVDDKPIPQVVMTQNVVMNLRKNEQIAIWYLKESVWFIASSCRMLKTLKIQIRMPDESGDKATFSGEREFLRNSQDTAWQTAFVGWMENIKARNAIGAVLEDHQTDVIGS